MSGKGFRERHGEKKSLADFLGGIPNPEFSEWLMGWPIGWTGLKPLEMDKCHSAQHTHGSCFREWLDKNKKMLETLV
jgi:hypothetical protein